MVFWGGSKRKHDFGNKDYKHHGPESVLHKIQNVHHTQKSAHPLNISLYTEIKQIQLSILIDNANDCKVVIIRSSDVSKVRFSTQFRNVLYFNIFNILC